MGDLGGYIGVQVDVAIVFTRVGQDVTSSWDELRKKASRSVDGDLSPCPSLESLEHGLGEVQLPMEDAQVPSPEPSSAASPLETPTTSTGIDGVPLVPHEDHDDDDDDLMFVGESRLEDLTVDQLQARLAKTCEKLKSAKYLNA